MEHLRDPQKEPMPSILATDLLQGMLARTGTTVSELEQCMHGGPAKKGTGLAQNFPAPFQGLLLCDGMHTHGPSSGLNAQGVWHSRRLQTYLPGLCDFLAWAMMTWAFHKLNFGPKTVNNCSGSRQHCWSWTHGRKESFCTSCLNENFVPARELLLASTMRWPICMWTMVFSLEQRLCRPHPRPSCTTQPTFCRR